MLVETEGMIMKVLKKVYRGRENNVEAVRVVLRP